MGMGWPVSQGAGAAGAFASSMMNFSRGRSPAYQALLSANSRLLTAATFDPFSARFLTTLKSSAI